MGFLSLRPSGPYVCQPRNKAARPRSRSQMSPPDAMYGCTKQYGEEIRADYKQY